LVAAQGGQVDDIEAWHAGFNEIDAGLEHALPFPGGIVAGVFPQIAFLARFFDGQDDGGPFLLEPLQFAFQLSEALNADRDAVHRRTLKNGWIVGWTNKAASPDRTRPPSGRGGQNEHGRPLG
jgi:hypothetical protein